MNKITALILVALCALPVGFMAGRSTNASHDEKCAIHPRLTDAQVDTIKTNLARVRQQAFDAAAAEKPDRDAANRAAEAAAFDTFVYNLRGPLNEEYLRHRHALDGCF